jgi:spermidine synthase
LLALGIGAAAAMEWIHLALQDIVDVGSNKASPQLVYFGTEARVADVASFIVPIEIVAALIFALVALTVVGIGQCLGRRFAVPDAVEGYMLNIGGSLAGVLLLQLSSWRLSPIGSPLFRPGCCTSFSRNNPKDGRHWYAASQRHCCCWYPNTFRLASFVKNSRLSCGHRITASILAETRTIVVNLLGHQIMVRREDAFPAYAAPYLVNRDAGQAKFRDILIIGAGSGNDVSRALQWADPDARIDAVEIDPVIQRLGARDHPDKPYQDPRVTVHLKDGPNFLRSTTKKYDLIVSALIDSLVLHSSVSNIRLESYLFTREAIDDVRRRLKRTGRSSCITTSARAGSFPAWRKHYRKLSKVNGRSFLRFPIRIQSQRRRSQTASLYSLPGHEQLLSGEHSRKRSRTWFKRVTPRIHHPLTASRWRKRSP